MPFWADILGVEPWSVDGDFQFWVVVFQTYNGVLVDYGPGTRVVVV
jgi:hypothetical protein